MLVSLGSSRSWEMTPVLPTKYVWKSATTRLYVAAVFPSFDDMTGVLPVTVWSSVCDCHPGKTHRAPSATTLTLPIDFRLEAVDEVDAAYEWYDERRADLGEEFLEALFEQLNDIQARPEGWAVLYRKIRACPMRRFPYIIYVSSLARADQRCRSSTWAS